VIRYAVAGAGRSGTGWVARVLTLAGGRCGHEQVLDHDRPGSLRRIQTTTLWGDASLAAGAYLDELGRRPVLHVLRDPLDTVRSWWGAAVDPASPYGAFMRREVPELDDPSLDQLGAAILWVVLWTEKIAAGVAGPYRWVRLEDLDRDTFADLGPFLGFVPKLPLELPAAVNRHDPADLSWPEVDEHPAGPALRRLADRYGYL
jgi:hypothetical protein